MNIVLNKKRKFSSRGFTLVEMMVAVSIFVIVAFIATSALISLSYAYKKAQASRLLMDNLNFSLGDMSSTLRGGKKFRTTTTPGSTYPDQLDFNPAEKWYEKDFTTSYCYKKIDTKLYSCPTSCSSCRTTNGISLLDDRITVDYLRFAVYGQEGFKQGVRIVISGKINPNPHLFTDFNIETFVTQSN